MNEALVQFLKFCGVGTSGLLIDFGSTYLGKEHLQMNKYVSSSFGFMMAGTYNYYLNRIWTFENSDPNWVPQYLLYLAITVIGLGVLNGGIYLLHEKLKLNFYLSKFLSLFLVLAWTFGANRYITFG